MATAGWRGTHPLGELLRREPQRFELLQAVRLLERDIGRDVRFRGSLLSGFPPSEIEQLDLPDDPKASVQLTLSFLTLAGAFGPLPRPLAELVVAAARDKDTAARDFLDLFNHRLIQLMIQLRRRTLPVAEPGPAEATRLGGWLFALLGLGTPGLQRSRRLNGLDRGLPLLVGTLMRRPVSLHAVERLLAHHFAVPARLTPLRGDWLPLDAEQTTRLGASGRNRELGLTVVLGRRVWDQTAGIRLTLGPLSVAALTGFLPGGKSWASLRTLLGFALDGTFAVELVLVPESESDRSARLGRGAPRLGWTAWLGSGATTPVRLRMPAGLPA